MKSLRFRVRFFFRVSIPNLNKTKKIVTQYLNISEINLFKIIGILHAISYRVLIIIKSSSNKKNKKF